MKFEHFQELRNETFRLYGEKEYEQALELLNQHAGQFPDWGGRTYNWRICLAALAGRRQEAIELFEQAVEFGYWWSEEQLRSDSDLASLQGVAEFEDLVEVCDARHEQALANSRPQRSILLPKGGAQPPYPLLLALHGRNSSPRTFQEEWLALSERGWLVALPQSSQILGSEAYGWDDRGLALSEIQAHLAELQTDYPLDPSRILLAGFSQGGGLAMLLALQGDTPCRGFLAVAPYVRGVEALEPAQPGGTRRGYLVLGGQDPNQGMFEQIESWLGASGIACQKEVHPELGHEFPQDFERSLEAALAYLLGGDLPTHKDESTQDAKEAR